MKKLFFIAAIAGAALVSCTKNEVAQVSFEKEITFAAPVVGVQTKALHYGEIGVNYNVNEHFGVYAVHYNGELPKWADGTLYMGEAGVGLECFKETSENYWAPALPYYWPKEGTLSFAAYSPYDVTGTVSYGAAGLSVVGHTVSTSTAEHVDFMYAPRVYNYEESTMNKTSKEEEAGDDDAVYKYDGVNILFKHAMSSIVINVARSSAIEEHTVITLNSLTIQNPYMTADFVENVTDGPSYNAAPYWVNRTNAKNVVTYNNPVDITTTLTEYVNNTDDDVILIPQELTSYVKLELNYDITTPGGHTINQVSYIDLKDFTPSWEMGKKYTYNITIGMEEIIFDPAVTDWAPESDDITL